jgi:hypothetical protein
MQRPVKERQMKLTRGLDVVRNRMRKVFHLDALKRASGAGAPAKVGVACEWVIIYRTAHGFCCAYRGAPIDFRDMLDLQIWAEEQNVPTYFIGF